MVVFSSLKRHQKEAIGLLQIGTFLEYFDLMLYVHMAVLLNELFFPKTDAFTSSLINAFSFCSAFIFRPFGALIFGYIGDHIGRKTTVIITTLMMSISCVVMANLPTYEQIGLSAAWAITICRIIQGLSSMGEIIGAQIYLTEITKPPLQYPAVSFLGVASDIGAMAALGISVLAVNSVLNWRIAFWIGAAIAVVGSIARIRLRETPTFIKSKKLSQREGNITDANNPLKIDQLSEVKKLVHSQQINKKTLMAYTLIQCGWPISFYLAFIFMNPTLKNVYGCSTKDIIFHNFLLSIIGCISVLIGALLSSKCHPLKILIFRNSLFLIFFIFFPILLSSAPSYYSIFLWQSLLIFFFLGDLPAASIFISYFPVLKRFRMISLVFALTRSLIYLFTSFGLIYLTQWFNYYGMWFVILPITLGSLWGTVYFIKLEKISGRFAHPFLIKDSNYIK